MIITFNYYDDCTTKKKKIIVDSISFDHNHSASVFIYAKGQIRFHPPTRSSLFVRRFLREGYNIIKNVTVDSFVGRKKPKVYSEKKNKKNVSTRVFSNSPSVRLRYNRNVIRKHFQKYISVYFTQ